MLRNHYYPDLTSVNNGMFMTKPITPRTPASLVEPAINKGTAFTETERRMLGLTGWLSSAVLTL